MPDEGSVASFQMETRNGTLLWEYKPKKENRKSDMMLMSLRRMAEKKISMMSMNDPTLINDTGEKV